MKANSTLFNHRQAGFTLVEIMVGLAIGMLATVVIIQVISVFEAQQRTTTGSADAQTNGGIALYNIGRELQMAGYPLIPVTNSPLECATLTIDGVADATAPNRLSPVAVVEGVATASVSASDTITIRYGDSNTGGVPSLITAPGQPNPSDETVSNNFGCQVGDRTLITNAGACAMSTVTAVSAAGTTPITVTLADTTAAGNNANLSCLGNWNEVTYAVNSATGNLERNGVPTVAGIVNLQVQYGVSASTNSNQVTRWVNAKNIADWSVAVDGPAMPEDWGTGITIANRNRIKAVRIAVVARNDKMESGNVTSACSSLTAAAPTGLCAWAGSVASPAPGINLSPGDANWARYRYRVFETIVPLRNMIWSKDTL